MPARKQTQLEIFEDECGERLHEALKNLAQQRSVDGDTRPPEVIAEDLARILNTQSKTTDEALAQEYEETRAALFATRSADISLFVHAPHPNLDRQHPSIKKTLLRVAEVLSPKDPLTIADAMAKIMTDLKHPYQPAIAALFNTEHTLIAEEARAAEATRGIPPSLKRPEKPRDYMQETVARMSAEAIANDNTPNLIALAARDRETAQAVCKLALEAHDAQHADNPMQYAEQLASLLAGKTDGLPEAMSSVDARGILEKLVTRAKQEITAEESKAKLPTTPTQSVTKAKTTGLGIYGTETLIGPPPLAHR